MKQALIDEILAPLWEVHDLLATHGDRVHYARMKRAMDKVKTDLENVIGDILDPE